MDNNSFEQEILSHPDFVFNSQAELFNSIEESLIITDTKKNIIYVNSSFIDAYNYNPEEIINISVEKLFVKKDLPTILNPVYEKENYKWKGKVNQVRKDESLFKAELKILRSSNIHNEADYIYFVVNDLSEHIRNRKELKLYEDKFQTLFFEIKDALYESTPEGKMLDINPAGVELFGYDYKEDLMAVNIAETLYVNPTDRSKFKKQLAREGYVKDYEIEIRRRNGEIATVLETAFAVKDENDEVVVYRGILRDITETKNYERKLRSYINELAEVNKQLIDSEKELKSINASKDKFFSIVAHDLRSPFTSLIGYSEFLRDDLNDLSNDEIKLFANNIHESSRIVFNLLENLLQWSRVQTGRIQVDPQIMDFSELVEQTIKLLHNNAEKKNIALVNNIPTHTLVYADLQTISSVIQNLTSNAIKFTPKDGQITISSKVKNDIAEIIVEDTGVGISKEDLNKLFKIDVHHTTSGTNKEEGSGLGLILCKELVEKNKGKIWVESEEGIGSKFHFTLPIQG